MLPQSFTELAGLGGILVPLIIATFAGLRAAYTQKLENDLRRWERVNAPAATLYNKDKQLGLWSQLAAAHELGEVSEPHIRAARAIISHARIHFAENIELSQALDWALARTHRGSWRSAAALPLPPSYPAN